MSFHQLIEERDPIEEPDVMQRIVLVVVVKGGIERDRIEGNLPFRLLSRLEGCLDRDLFGFFAGAFPVIAVIAQRNDVFVGREFSKTTP